MGVCTKVDLFFIGLTFKISVALPVLYADWIALPPIHTNHPFFALSPQTALPSLRSGLYGCVL